jgi:hypothetical protein
MKVFITGDRSFAHEAAMHGVVAAINGLRQEHPDDGLTFVTGDNKGVEHAVREAFAAFDVPLEVVSTPVLESGKPDWDGRHAAVKETGADHVVMLHNSPLSSSIGKSASATFGDDELTIAPVA